jgi:hypothetical protein
MASERQLRANRSNAQKSTGPRSRTGKKRASQNAYRHGLSSPILQDTDWIINVEELAREIVNSTDGQIDLGHARSIAYAQLEVLRIRSISTAVVARILVDREYCGRTTSADRKHLAVRPTVSGEELDLTAEAIGRALSAFKVFDRYERRAASKRRRLVRLYLEEYLSSRFTRSRDEIF